MSLTTTPLPFGLRDVKFRTLTNDVEGAAVDLPVSRTFSFSEAEDSEELRGDDGVQAVHGMGSGVDWELESGGISFEALKAINGGTITESGVTPNRVKEYEKKETDQRPYFSAEGQAISDSGGDFHVVLYKCKATGEITGEMGDGSFWLTGASGRAIGRASDRLIYKFVQNETETAIATGVNELQGLNVDATGGTYDMDHAHADIAAIVNIPFGASVAALQVLVDAATSNGVDIEVSGVPGQYELEYKGTLAETNVVQFVVDSTNLTGGSQTAACTTIRAGSA